MADEGFDISSLLENRLFQQYLSGAGASIAGEGSFASDLDKINQQNISAQSQAAVQEKYMQWLAKLLGKGLDVKSGEDGKLTVSGTNEMMSSILGGFTGSEGNPFGIAESAPPTPIIPSSTPQGGRGNPFGIPEAPTDPYAFNPFDI